MQKIINRSIVVYLIIGGLCACSATREQLAQVGNPPPMTETDSPIEKPSYRPIHWPEEKKKPTLANSLWQPGAQTFFRDHRARSLGDILKVVVEINDKAELDNSTERNRDTTKNLNAANVFGFENTLTKKLLPDAADPSSLLSVGGTSDHKGEGTIDREEKIKTEVAAMVTQILPNGNLVVSGSQEIRVNFEVRELTVQGIVSPKDISADNSINSSQMAEARISYGGRGQLSDFQQPAIGSQIVDILSPF